MRSRRYQQPSRKCICKMAGIDFITPDPQTIVLQGFDAIITPSQFGDAYAFVTLAEQNDEVWSGDIPLPQEQEGATIDLINEAAQAAIDIFESERGTLGMGAGADVPEQGVEIMANKKAFTYQTMEHEEWYLSFKGTQFEDVAFNLLENLYSLELEQATIEDTNTELWAEQTDIEHKLKMLNLQRLREIPAGAKVIIIQAHTYKKHAWFNDHADLQLFVDSFASTSIEPEVMKLVNRYLDVRQELNKRDESHDSMYEAHQAIENQMESLSLECLQRNVIEKIPTEGIGAFPEMASDMAELMEGVSIDEPLVEMPAFQGMPFETMRTSKKSEEPKREVKELGQTHLGLDPAEILSEDRLPFQKGDKVQISKAFETSTVGGCPMTLDGGLKGVIKTEFDGHGNSFVVCFEDGSLLNVPTENLKKSS